MAESTTQAATRELVAALPELQRALDEHLDLNGEILAHVFFDDAVAFSAEDAARAHDEVAARRLGAALERLAASGDPDVLNVLEVSFVEHFEWGRDEDRAALEWLTRFFGPAMLGCVERFRAYSAGYHAMGGRTGRSVELLWRARTRRWWRRWGRTSPP